MHSFREMNQVQWGLGRKCCISPDRGVYSGDDYISEFPSREVQQVGRFWIKDNGELRERKQHSCFWLSKAEGEGEVCSFPSLTKTASLIINLTSPFQC